MFNPLSTEKKMSVFQAELQKLHRVSVPKAICEALELNYKTKVEITIHKVE